MEGRDINNNDDLEYDLPWWLPLPPLPASNSNNVSSSSLLNPTSQQQNPYFGYPSSYHQNPNPQSYFVQNHTTPQNHSPGGGTTYPNNVSPSFHSPPVPLRQYQHSSLDQLVHGLISSQNGFGRVNQLVPVPQYPLTSLSSSHTSIPFDLLSGLGRLNLDDLGLSIPNNNSNPWRNYSTDRYATSSNNNGSTINGSRSIISTSATAALSSSMYDDNNNFDVIIRPPRPNNRVNYSSIKELRGRIKLVAKDEQGCRFLRKKVDEMNPIDIEMILLEVIVDDLHDLMQHQSANYLIQKLIGVLNEEQLTKFILSIISSQQRLFTTCDDLTGSRVIQKLLDSSEYPQRQPLTPDQKSLIVSALKDITVTLSKSTHGNHVIKRCLQKFPYEYTKDLVEEVSENCINLATDRSGCCLLQDCIKYAQDELKGRLISDVVSNALFLSDHSYGNYVVQYILGLKIPQVTADVLAQFAGNYYTLCQGKCSSNVVEKCLLESGKEQSTNIINEIILHPEVSDLLLHPFGNYVIQTAWTVSQNHGMRIRQTLHTLVEMRSTSLQSHIYGKRVLAKVRGNKNCFHERVPPF